MPSESTSPAATANRRGLVGRVVIPIALLIVIIGSSFRALSSAKLPDTAYLSCHVATLRADAPPADVVFFGSSRTGAGIDAQVVADVLAADAAPLRTVEKFSLPLGSELDRDLSVRTYLRHRGVPKVLAIEASFERVPERITGSAVRPSGRTSTLYDVEVYEEFIAGQRARGRAGLLDTYVRSRFQSTPGYFFDRLGVGFDHASRSPQLVAWPVDQCGNRRGSRTGRWVNPGDAKPYVEAEASKPEQRKLRKLRRMTNRSRPINLRSRWASQELRLVRVTVDAALAAGVEHVVVYYFPSFDEPPNYIDLRILARWLPDVTIFDGRKVFADPTRPLLRFQYYDGNHANLFGAHELSSALGHAIATLEKKP